MIPCSPAKQLNEEEMAIIEKYWSNRHTETFLSSGVAHLWTDVILQPGFQDLISTTDIVDLY